MGIYMYILKFDSGFAPNPFHGWCTLACCKPAIRRKARPGDWVVGITPRDRGNCLAYAMKVEQALSFEQYWTDPRFRAKRPHWGLNRPTVEMRGDNCYEPTGDGNFRQVRSRHWDHKLDREDEESKAKDLRGKQVLVARRFSYFGEDAEPLPPSVTIKLPARYSRVNFTEREQSVLQRWLEALPQGVNGRPVIWAEGDTSWRGRQSQCG